MLLLDEPFGALDAKVRKDLRHWLRSLHERLGLTTIFVTHDQEEALELADLVAVMNEGRIEQIAPTGDVTRAPGDPVRGGFPRPTDCPRRRDPAQAAGAVISRGKPYEIRYLQTGTNGELPNFVVVTPSIGPASDSP